MVRSIITPGKIIFSGVVLIGLLFTGILLIAMDSSIWVPPESEYNQIEIDIPVRLLDRRTAERRSDDVCLSETRCDNCDVMNVSTIGYGDARVCSACLRILPPLV